MIVTVETTLIERVIVTTEHHAGVSSKDEIAA
jgi:hypothetical protein